VSTPPSSPPAANHPRAPLEGAAETLALSGIALAPWAYGGAVEWARYGLCTLLLLAGALWGIARALRGDGVPALAVPAAALPALALVQIASFSTAAPVATAEALVVASAMLVAFVFWSERGRDRPAARRLAAVVLATCAAQAVFAVVSHAAAPGRVYGRVTESGSSFGSYVNHNHFAGLIEMGCVLAAGVAVARWKRDRGPSPSALALGGLALGLASAHLASRSRGGLLALTGGALLLGVFWAWASWRESPSRVRAGAMAVGGAVLVLGFGLLMVSGDTRAHLATILRGGGDASGAYRVDVAAGTLRLAASHPVLGSGLGAFADAFPAVKRGHGELRTTHAESDVLELLAEGGLAGLLALAWLAYVAARSLGERIRHGRDPQRNGLAIAGAAAAGALMVHSLFDFNLRLPANALVFAALCGLAAAPRGEPAAGGGGRASALAALLLLALCVLAGWRAAGAVALDHALAEPDAHRRIARLSAVRARHPYLPEAGYHRALAWRGLASRPQGWVESRLQRAEDDLRDALALRPRWAEAWGELGRVLQFRGRPAEARAAFDRAAALDPTHLHLGRARADFRAATEGPVAGVEELRRVRRHNPGWPLAEAREDAARWSSDAALRARLEAPDP
jgi:hypothetical protein